VSGISRLAVNSRSTLLTVRSGSCTGNSSRFAHTRSYLREVTFTCTLTVYSRSFLLTVRSGARRRYRSMLSTLSITEKSFLILFIDTFLIFLELANFTLHLRLKTFVFKTLLFRHYIVISTKLINFTLAINESKDRTKSSNKVSTKSNGYITFTLYRWGKFPRCL
jgi:hypothetical protein